MINPKVNDIDDRKISVSYVTGLNEDYNPTPYIDVKLVSHLPFVGKKKGLSLYNRYSLNEAKELQKKVRECLQRHCISLNKGK